MKLYDISVAVGQYQGKDGETKKRRRNIGEVHHGDKGMYALIDPYFNFAALPRKDGSDRVTVAFFEPRKESGGHKPPARPQREAAPQTEADFDDSSIPF